MPLNTSQEQASIYLWCTRSQQPLCYDFRLSRCITGLGWFANFRNYTKL